MVTDRLQSYSATRKQTMPSLEHNLDRYANNSAEASCQQTRQQERQMQRFRSLGQTLRFLAVHSQVHNLIRLGHYLL